MYILQNEWRSQFSSFKLVIANLPNVSNTKIALKEVSNALFVFVLSWKTQRYYVSVLEVNNKDIKGTLVNVVLVTLQSI